jgi:hypothetical protein
MPIEPHALAEGKCYATPDGEMRKVLKIAGDDVTYVSRPSRSDRAQPEGEETIVSVVTFAADVDRIIDSD